MDPNQTNQKDQPSSSDQPSQDGPKQSDIAPKAAARRGRLFDPTGRIEGLTNEETMIADIRRHPFGLFVIYLQIIVALLLAMGLIAIFLPTLEDITDISKATLNSLGAVFALFTLTFGLLFLILATRIYRGNQLIVSDKNVTQVLQIGLFNRKISELSMANIEDVTAQQQGIFPTLLNYGELRIETAGEQNNFTFIYCPNPNAYAKAILDSRLAFITENDTE